MNIFLLISLSIIIVYVSNLNLLMLLIYNKEKFVRSLLT